jgi:ssDNA-binding Zn-finger/Zn-ribbon topoisomerase 1
MKTIRELINLIESAQQPVFTPEILPCAKCGAKARLIDWDFKGHWRVMCDNNHAMKGENITQNRAVHKWNNLQNKLTGEQDVAEGSDDDTSRLEVMRSEYAKAHKILNKFGNANMGRIEVMRLLLDNGISQKTANIFASKRPIKEQGVAEGEGGSPTQV